MQFDSSDFIGDPALIQPLLGFALHLCLRGRVVIRIGEEKSSADVRENSEGILLHPINDAPVADRIVSTIQ